MSPVCNIFNKVFFKFHPSEYNSGNNSQKNADKDIYYGYFNSKRVSIRTTRYSFTKGEVTKKENAIPSGILASRNPIKIGIDEHEQKGLLPRT